MAIDFSTESTLQELKYILQALNPLLVPLATETTASSILSVNSSSYGVLLDVDSNTAPATLYHSISATISVDTTYTMPYVCRGLELYCSKAVVVKLATTGDAIALPANIGLKANHFVFDKVILTSVPASTTVTLLAIGG